MTTTVLKTSILMVKLYVIQSLCVQMEENHVHAV